MNKSLVCIKQLPEELLKAAKCVYSVCDEESAEHISQLLTHAKARIHELEQGNKNLYKALLTKKRQPVVWRRN